MKKNLIIIVLALFLLNSVLIDARLTEIRGIPWWQRIFTPQSIWVDGVMTDRDVCQAGDSVKIRFTILTPLSNAGEITSYTHKIFNSNYDRTSELKNIRNTYGNGYLTEFVYDVQCPTVTGNYLITEILETTNQPCPTCLRWDTQMTSQSAPADTCSQQGGQVCSGNQICTGRWMSASDTDKCCSVVCTIPTECTPSFQCSEWSSCSNNQQTRTCSDSNNCQDAKVETQSCGVISGGNIQIISIDYPHTFLDDKLINIGKLELSGTGQPTASMKVRLKNFGNATETINIEGGIYSRRFAKETAKLYSIFNLFAIQDIDNCVSNETLIDAKKVTIEAGKEEEVILKVNPLAAISTDSNIQSLKDSFVAFAGLYKECGKGYINDAGITERGKVYDYAFIDYVYPSVFGWKKIYCSDMKTVAFEAKDYAIRKVGNCASSDYRKGEEETYQDAIELSKDKTTEEYLQKGIDTDKIAEKTTKDLFKSTCIEDAQCEEGSSCKPITWLIDNEYLTEKQATDKLESSAKIVYTTIGISTGAVLGASAITQLCFISSIAVSPIILPVCAGIGAISGAVIGGTVGYRTTDLINAISSKNPDGYGYCIIEESISKNPLKGFFDFLEKQGVPKKNSEMVGYVILIIAGIFILKILFDKK